MTIFKTLSSLVLSPNLTKYKIIDIANTNTVNIIAYPTYPVPMARPIAIAKKTSSISLELPGILLNLIKENAPRTATLVPKLPFTKSITIVTSIGKIANVVIKFLFDLLVFICKKETTKPSKNETAIQIIKALIVILSPIILLNINITHFLLIYISIF